MLWLVWQCSEALVQKLALVLALLLWSPSLLCSPHDKPMNLRDEGLRQERDFIWGPTDREDGRLAPQSNHLIGAWMPGSFIDQRWGEVRKQSKKAFNFASI